MKVKVATTIAINLVHIVDLIELLDKNAIGVKGTILNGQIMLARKATSKIIEILDKEGVE